MPPEPSASILAKKHSHKTQDGLPLQSVASLLGALGTLTRNTCAMRLKDDAVEDKAQKMPVPAKTEQKKKGKTEEPKFSVISDATPVQERALKLLGLYPVR